MIPRSLFASDGDWQRFRQHVQTTVPKEPSRRLPVWRWAIYAVFVLIIIVSVLVSLFSTR
jgi:hypothetical protein